MAKKTPRLVCTRERLDSARAAYRRGDTKTAIFRDGDVLFSDWFDLSVRGRKYMATSQYIDTCSRRLREAHETFRKGVRTRRATSRKRAAELKVYHKVARERGRR